MAWNIRMVSTYPPRRCGIGTFCRDLSNALSQFSGEVGHIRIAAIDNNHGPYNIPVDLVIDQYNPDSWKKNTQEIIARAKESNNPTAIVLQHEFGLDPDEDGNDGVGHNFVNIAKACRENNLTCLVYLHTVLEKPNDHQRQTVIDLAEISNGLIVTTESAIDILESNAYGISHFKLKHIDHGIRMHHPTQFDRFAIKQELGINDIFLATTLGLLSPGKGVQYSIRAFGRFIHESCTPAQRQHVVYLIGGQCHPEFVKAEGGKYYKAFMDEIDAALKEADVKWCKATSLENIDWFNNDIVFLDMFLAESDLLNLYGATNVMILPYLNMEQISSGILADTIGSGRVAIATKFRYALELIYSNKTCPPGVTIGRFARGILVDPEEAAIEEIASALDFLVFEKEKRLRMEKQAHQRGYQMRWANSAWAMVQYIDFVSEEKEIMSGRGMKFLREKESSLTIKTKRGAISRKSSR
ncbi:MAG: glycosyltransferase family protein [Planctomycetota bacterium]|jgi:glycosyltransferase involved in cell wall biosynthesis